MSTDTIINCILTYVIATLPIATWLGLKRDNPGYLLISIFPIIPAIIIIIWSA